MYRMNSYGDPRSHGRAQVSGNGQDAYDGYDAYRAYQDEYAVDSYGADPYPADPYRPDPPPSRSPSPSPSPARATVGAARVGAPSADPTAPPAPRYDWSRGGQRGASGRATVPVSPGPASGVRGRASVPPPGAGGPGGPPGSRGPGGPSGGRPPARKPRKRHWLRNSLLASLAVLVMLIGGGMVALSYYVEDVVPPGELDLDQASRIHYAGGEEMAVLQEENRELIDTENLKIVQDAVVAAEDQKFWEHSGVDFAGIARAAWNNVTGGEIQGASTITQQYARIAGDLHGQTYTRKLEEASMAYKLSQEYDRKQILEFYLNTVYFGRGAYGIEAAAQTYFGVGAAELDVAQAAMLAGIIRYPDDGSGFSPYDPMNDAAVAEERWRWVLDHMVEMGTLDPTERDQLALPEVQEPSSVEPWHEGPQGPIVRQVRRELEEMGIDDLSTGGYRVTTTIDPDIQEAALDAARRGNEGRLWEGEEGFRTPADNVDSSLVAVEPGTGRVLAYYGGDDGTAWDNAGKNWSEWGEWWEGGRPPGSSFKIYTLIAALRENVALETRWQAGEYETEGGQTIRNAGRTPQGSGCPDPDWCTLRWATEQSFNVPFFHFSEQMGPSQGPPAIVQAAKDAGITMIKDDDDVPHDLLANEPGEVAPEHIFHHVAFGQYAVTVLDHASGVATIASGGVYNEPHFVETVEKRNERTGEWEVVEAGQIAGEQRVEEPIANAITGVLQGVPAINDASLADGRESAAKTGTWEHDDGGNADAWVVGYTPQIATAVWVGDPSDDPQPVRYTDGGDIGSSGLPAHIWKQFMDGAHAAKELPHEPFPPEPQIGDTQHALANGVPPAQDDEDDCRLPSFLCNDDDDDDSGNGGNGNGGDGNGGNGNDDRQDDDDDSGEGGGLLRLPGGLLNRGDSED